MHAIHVSVSLGGQALPGTQQTRTYVMCWEKKRIARCRLTGQRAQHPRCLHSLMCVSEAVLASSLPGLLGPNTYHEVDNDDEGR